MNKVILSGRLTKDPDVKEGYTRFTLAVERKYKKDGQDSADFITCVAFGKTAEIIRDYMSQGSKVLAEGRWQTGSYTAQDGSKRYTNDCVVDSVEFFEPKKQEPEKKEEGFMQMEIDLDDDSLPFN